MASPAMQMMHWRLCSGWVNKLGERENEGEGVGVGVGDNKGEGEGEG